MLAGFLLLGTAGTKLLAQDIRTERVSLQCGSTGAAIESSISGYETAVLGG